MAVQCEAVGGRRHRSTKFAVAVDWFPSPRPGVLLGVVIFEEELSESLFDACASLVQQRRAADETTNLKEEDCENDEKNQSDGGIL